MATVHLNLEHPEGGYAARVVRARAHEYLDKLGMQGAEVSILLTTDPRIRKLNRQFRGKDKATDVLSFPAGDLPSIPGVPLFVGDVAISLDTARRRAVEDGRSLAFELSRYLAHGLLHLLGYDHEKSERAARVMARREAELLGVPGMLDDASGVGPSREKKSRVEGEGRPPRRRKP
ncbi:rRNA maturation RNase YbeY [Vulgatibacter sp.]|uniref:rRNA maturation RNase YbeY n=1 Tax=Vulgatibacter sp. TaxID=1971226 RepID=UPI0035683745